MDINYNNQKGVALIITFFVMIMIVASVLFTSLFLYSRIAIIRNISDSVASFYLADSGIEKLFYYDRKVIPTDGTRGACYMCAISGSCSSGAGALNCQCQPLTTGSFNPIHGCDPTVCNDCQVSFDTTYENKKYTVNATIFPPSDPTDIKIQSFGLFDNIGRAIEVFLDK